MAQIIAFKLEFGAVSLPQLLNHVLHVREGVAEDEIAGHLQELRLPFVLPAVVLARHWKDAEVHGANVQRSHFRACRCCGAQAFFARHPQSAPGRNIHDSIC